MSTQEAQVRHRGDLFDLLDKKMRHTYFNLLSDGQVKANENYLKTYLLEFNTPSTKYEAITSNLLTQKLTIPSHKSGIADKIPAIETTEDNGLYVAKWGAGEKKPATTFYLDTAINPQDPGDSRFWIAHTFSGAAQAESVVRNLSSRATPIDRVWLWPGLLRQIQNVGTAKSVSLVYDQTHFDPESKPQDSRKQARASFKEEALELWRILNESPYMGESATAIRDRLVESKISINYKGDAPDSSNQFAIEDIHFTGKFTARGTSARLHQELVRFTEGIYRSKVLEIEERHTIFKRTGEALYFVFDQGLPVEKEFFCERVFSSKAPFHLWGVPERSLDGKGLVINAVDIGTGSKMFFQVYDDIISLNLRPGSCGNSVIKFFTNLQQIYGRNVSAETADGQPIF